ncbi:MerR family transcriptional regulator [Streptomyces sp. NPDC048483]|uniref:MerR family transcriptional regulator n=1 Tax=Streptomyces sp. NPDC048483 TaxID=3154927 RepID=UPI003423DDFD
MEQELLSIGSVAERFGVPVSTLHYWERRGIVLPTERRNGRRHYGPREVHRIALVLTWQDTGLMSLDEIAAVLVGRTADEDWRDAVARRIDEIDAQAAKLAVAREYLAHMLRCPRDNPARDCPELRGEVERRQAAP